jgi:oxygenase
VGARLPHTTVLSGEGHLSTTELLRAGRGLLLDLSGGAGPPLPGCDAWADRVGFLAALPRKDSPLEGSGRLLVRPDGYVAWAGTETHGLRQALERWFGPAH